MAKKKTTPKVASIPTPPARQPQAPTEPVQEPYAIRFEKPDDKTGKNILLGELILNDTGMVFKGDIDKSAEKMFEYAVKLYEDYLGRQARIKLLEAEIANLR